MTVTIREDFIKLDSLLKLSGIASTGGHAKILITVLRVGHRKNVYDT